VDLKENLADYAADKLLILADVSLQKNQKPKAVECADKALDASRNEDVIFAAAQIYLRAGAEDKAKAIAAELGKKVPSIIQAEARLLEGEISSRKGDAPGAVRLFREAQSLVDTWLGRFLMGHALLEAGAFTEAYTEFDLCLKRRGEAASVFMNDLPSYRYFPLVYYDMGRTQEGLRSPAARESYQIFLKIKEKSAGDPLVEDAKKRLASLK
jgi:tetratricopeptide (TPR) repeat protein